jgi:hypothetical protein
MSRAPGRPVSAGTAHPVVIAPTSHSSSPSSSSGAIRSPHRPSTMAPMQLPQTIVHPIVVKVMRIPQARLDCPRVIVEDEDDLLFNLYGDQFPVNPKHIDDPSKIMHSSLPTMGLQSYMEVSVGIRNMHLGEKFKALISLQNITGAPLQEVFLSVDMTVANQRTPLFEDKETLRRGMGPNTAKDFVVEHMTHVPGAHILSCVVGYKKFAALEMSIFKKSFKFLVVSPIEITHSITTGKDGVSNGKFFVNADITNTSTIPLSLDSLTLEPTHDFDGILVPHFVVGRTERIILPKEKVRFLYEIRVHHENDMGEMSGWNMRVRWQTGMGSGGEWKIGPLHFPRRAFGSQKSILSIESIQPAKVCAHQPFRVKFRLRSLFEGRGIVSLRLSSTHSSSSAADGAHPFRILGSMTVDVGDVDPKSKPTEFYVTFFAEIPGIHLLGPFDFYNTSTGKTVRCPPVRSIFVHVPSGGEKDPLLKRRASNEPSLSRKVGQTSDPHDDDDSGDDRDDRVDPEPTSRKEDEIIESVSTEEEEIQDLDGHGLAIGGDSKTSVVGMDSAVDVQDETESRVIDGECGDGEGHSHGEDGEEGQQETVITSKEEEEWREAVNEKEDDEGIESDFEEVDDLVGDIARNRSEEDDGCGEEDEDEEEGALERTSGTRPSIDDADSDTDSDTEFQL